MENKINLSIVIPAYKEEENLRLLLPRIITTLKNLKITYEVIVIDSLEGKDNTKKVCKENKVKYLNRRHGNFYGDAIKTGINSIQGEYTIFMDGDGSHSPEFIENLYNNRQGHDVVIASRYVEGGGTDNKKLLIIMSCIVNYIYSFVLGLKCKDVSNSFKLYKTIDLTKLQLKSNNFDIVEELLFKLKINNKDLKIKEIPYLFKERMFGHTKRNLFAFMFSYFFTLIKLRFSN